MSGRTILHSDLNNYYASVECMLDPSLRDKYVAVCGRREDRHGIVLAKNQRAKLCGVTTGETIWQAKEKCPDLVIVPPHYSEYMKYSKLVKSIYYRYTDLIEPFGLDECWLDVSGSSALFGKGESIANSIRETVKSELKLTVSVGVSFNKIFAKLGSDMKKPDAVTVISPEGFREKVWPLPVGELLGVGRATRSELLKKNIKTIGELAMAEREMLALSMGVHGEKLWLYANGLDSSAVRTFGVEPPAKSMGHGITCTQDLYTNSEVKCVLLELSQGVSHRLRQAGAMAGRVQLSVKDDRLATRQYQGCLPRYTQSFRELTERAMQLFNNNYQWTQPVRALTITAIDLRQASEPTQPDIFTDMARVMKNENIELAMERVQDKYGRRAIRPAALISGLKMPAQNFEETLIMPKYCGN